MLIGTEQKDPTDVLDYDVNFAPWLDPGDTVSGATATSSLADVVVDSVTVGIQIVKVWVSGGIDKQTATIDVVATTTMGRTKKVCFKLRIKEDC